MNTDRKKELKNAYKEREVVGGVCCIRCAGNGRVWIQPTNDIESLRNRFNFAILTKGCPDPTTRPDWEKYGSESFYFSVLETLKKGEDQTDREFADDIETLCELWVEKQNSGELE